VFVRRGVASSARLALGRPWCGHHHLNVTSTGERPFFGETLGGTDYGGRPADGQVPERTGHIRAKPTAGSEGQLGDHLGFGPNLRAGVDKIKANGFRMVTKEEAPAPWW
jgi:hypothetical protein